jgi:hypothetical protein
MKMRTKVISPLGTFESDAADVTKDQAEQVKDVFKGVSGLSYLSIVSGGETIYFPAEVI